MERGRRISEEGEQIGEDGVVQGGDIVVRSGAGLRARRGGASNSDMSDETRDETEFTAPADVEAPTERDPRVGELASGMPARGVALSVLWWLEDDGSARR